MSPRKYYKKGGIETIDFIKAKTSKSEYRGFLRGNIIKYISRGPYKGCEKEDYEKALYYMQLLVEC